jgi:cell division protein FtsB
MQQKVHGLLWRRELRYTRESRTVSKTAKQTERKNKLVAEINALRDQRAALKAAPVAAAPAAPKPKAKAAAKPAAKPTAPAKKTKAAAKK